MTVSTGPLSLHSVPRVRREIGNDNSSQSALAEVMTTIAPEDEIIYVTCNVGTGAETCACYLMEEEYDFECCWDSQGADSMGTVGLQLSGVNLLDFGQSLQLQIYDTISLVVESYCWYNNSECGLPDEDIDVVFIGAASPYDEVLVVIISASATSPETSERTNFTSAELAAILIENLDMIAYNLSVPVTILENWTDIINVTDFCSSPVPTSEEDNSYTNYIIAGSVCGAILVLICVVSARKAIV